MSKHSLSMLLSVTAMLIVGCVRGTIIDEKEIVGIERAGGQIRGGGCVVECTPLGDNETRYRVLARIDSPNEFEKSQLRIGFEQNVYFLKFGDAEFVDRDGKVVGAVVIIRRNDQSSPSR